MLIRWIAIVTLVALFGVPAAVADAVYTWVDEDGIRHFSQQPPESGEYELRDVNVQLPTTPAPTPAPSSGGASSTSERVDEFLSQQEEAQRQRRLSEADQAARQQNCQIAQQNLVSVESRTRVMVAEADGSMRQLTDDERLAAVEQARQDVEKFCD